MAFIIPFHINRTHSFGTVVRTPSRDSTIVLSGFFWDGPYQYMVYRPDFNTSVHPTGTCTKQVLAFTSVSLQIHHPLIHPLDTTKAMDQESSQMDQICPVYRDHTAFNHQSCYLPRKFTGKGNTVTGYIRHWFIVKPYRRIPACEAGIYQCTKC